jgi:hypothetical protein
MVISALPILCETSARWLAEGRSSADDRAELERDIAAAGRQRSNIRKAGFNMGRSPLLSGAVGCQVSQHLSVHQKAGFLRDLVVQLQRRFIVSCVCQYTLLQPACFAY